MFNAVETWCWTIFNGYPAAFKIVYESTFSGLVCAPLTPAVSLEARERWGYRLAECTGMVQHSWNVPDFGCSGIFEIAQCQVVVFCTFKAGAITTELSYSVNTIHAKICQVVIGEEQ